MAGSGLDKLRIVGVCGSLRKDSYNLKLLKAAGDLLPGDAHFSIADISALPLYNTDLEAALPHSVTTILTELQAADGVIITCPEYNFSFTAALKNMLEWVSRGRLGTPLAGKPVAVMGATMGAFGTQRGQMHLRDVLFAIDARPVPRPEVTVPFVQNKFSPEGKLTDAPTEDFIRQLLDNLLHDTRAYIAKKAALASR
jgi:chromate reductase